MIFQIRAKDIGTMVDIETYITSKELGSYTELRTWISIKEYTEYLLNIKDSIKQLEFCIMIDEVSEMRGWLWEVYKPSKKTNEEQMNDIILHIKTVFKNICNMFERLYINED